MNDSRTENSAPHPVRSDHPLPRGEGNSNATPSRSPFVRGRGLIQRQSRRLEVKFPGQMEMIPIEMRHIWEQKRYSSCQFMRTAAICPRIKPGEGARPILSVGLSAFKGGRVVRVPSRRPRPESEPRRKKTHGR